MEIKGIKYKFGKMNARKQFHVMRRLTPAIGQLGPVLKMIGGGVSGLSEDDKADVGLQVIEPIGKALASLKDEDADFVLDELLNCVSRDNGNGLGFSPIRTNGVDMFEDIDMPSMLMLAFGAIKANFADFIPAIRSILNPANQKQSEQ